jgi:hypothetical protein
MTSNDSAAESPAGKDRRKMLSTLWVFVVLNFLYADIFTLFFDPAAQTQTLDLSSGSVLFFAVVMETAMLMVLLSRVLPHAWNRWTNIGVATLHTAVLAWSLSGSAVTPFYAFFVTVEVATLLFVVGCAWSWRKQLAT